MAARQSQDPQRAAGDASSSSSGSSSSSSGAAVATAFRGLALVSAALGAAAIAAPGPLAAAVASNASAAAAAASPLEEVFLRIAGGTLAISFAVEWSLADAAAGGRLGPERSTLAAIAVKNALYLAGFAATRDAWTPLLAVLFPSAPLVSLVAVAAAWRLAGAGGEGGAGGAGGAAAAGAGAAGGGERAAGATTPGLLALPRGAAGWVYTAFALLYAATLAACYAPEVMFTGAPMTPLALLLKRTWAPGFWLCGAACLSLRDAADGGRLGTAAAVRLNLGLAAVEVVYSAVFASAILAGLAAGDGAAYSNLGGSAGIALYCLYQAAAAAGAAGSKGGEEGG